MSAETAAFAFYFYSKNDDENYERQDGDHTVEAAEGGAVSDLGRLEDGGPIGVSSPKVVCPLMSTTDVALLP